LSDRLTHSPNRHTQASKAEAVSLGRALEQWRQHQQQLQQQQQDGQGGPGNAAADMLLRLCARLLRRVGGLQRRNAGLEARVGRLESQVGVFAVQMAAATGARVGVPASAQQRRPPAAMEEAEAPSLHASRVMAFEDEDGDADEEEQFRPLKKRLDDLNASLLASAPAAPAAANSKPSAALSASFHATVASVDAGLAAEEERQRMMAMMKDMFQSAASGPGGLAASSSSSSTGMPGKRLGQGKGLGGVGQKPQQKQKPSASVMALGKWRRPGWAARGGAMAAAEKGMPN
jgi:hypothetical protein